MLSPVDAKDVYSALLSMWRDNLIIFFTPMPCPLKWNTTASIIDGVVTEIGKKVVSTEL